RDARNAECVRRHPRGRLRERVQQRWRGGLALAEEAQGHVPLVRPAQGARAEPARTELVAQGVDQGLQPFRLGGARAPRGEQRLAHAARDARLRSTSVRSFLRRRICFGVTSTSSSSSMNSSACSSENLIAGTRPSSSSLPAARKLVSCLARRALTVRSLSLLWMPTIWPS